MLNNSKQLKTMNEQHDIYKIIKQTLDNAQPGINLTNDNVRHDIALELTTRVNQHVNRLIEDIVIPAGSFGHNIK